MGMGNAPVIILREGTKREKGKDAQFNNISAARAISDAVRSSLGPRGMDKMLVDSVGDVVITNDGVTILKEMDVQHPAAKMLVEVAKTQDAEVGDGTTTSVILAGELLKKATDLIDANVHPTIIASGYRLANDKAQEVLKNISKKVSIDDNDMLKLIAQTAMISKQRRRQGQGRKVHRRPEEHPDRQEGRSQDGGVLHRQGTHHRQGARPAEHAQDRRGCQDRPDRRPVRGQEDRDRRQDPDHRPQPAVPVHRRGGEDAEGHGHEGPWS